jgi:Uma2 family endonuclease
MDSVENITTAEQLLAAGDIGRCELIRGRLITMPPNGAEHGWIAATLAASLATFAERRSVGAVFGTGTGFRLASNPDTVRAPDVAFVTAERISGKLARGFFPGPPDLAVEVLSPEDRASEVLAKVQEWLDAGCRAVWVADPRTQSVTVYRSRSEIAVLTVAETLDGGELLPGVKLPLGEVFL